MTNPRYFLIGAGVAAAIAAAAIVLPAAGVRAEGDFFAPVAEPTTLKECSACHMAYPAGLLPARSWWAVMGGLNDHFGENASLDAKMTATITDYLVANAADAKTNRSKVTRGLDAAVTPLRISDLPWWHREHDGEVGPKAFANPKVGSRANCGACHAGAAKGYFEDD